MNSAAYVHVEAAAAILQQFTCSIELNKSPQDQRQLQEACGHIVHAAVEEVAARLAAMQAPPLPMAVAAKDAMVAALRGEE